MFETTTKEHKMPLRHKEKYKVINARTVRKFSNNKNDEASQREAQRIYLGNIITKEKETTLWPLYTSCTSEL